MWRRVNLAVMNSDKAGPLNIRLGFQFPIDEMYTRRGVAYGTVWTVFPAASASRASRHISRTCMGNMV
jgi:hypothetical protein